METGNLNKKAAAYLEKLCVDIDNRRTGSAGNRAAADFFAEAVSSFGFATETPLFDCLDWRQEGAELTVDGAPFEVFPSPYTLGCQVKGPLVVVNSAADLKNVDLTCRILLMRGEITGEQLMPKNFPFYNPDHHKEIYQLLEAKKPLAIITATGQDLEMVGSQYPFPLFEDGDFDIPSVYMKDIEGDRLAALNAESVSLEIRAERLPSHGYNVIAGKGKSFQRRVVLFAHIDAKVNTPGATDNAAGVIVLLLLAELLSGYAGDLGIEIVALNGEDYYSSPGEQQYLALNAGKLTDIILGINIDGVGYIKGKAAYSLYGCPPEMTAEIEALFANYDSIVPGEPWYAGDHGLFLMNNVPALALTSNELVELMAEITHTPKDTPEIVNPAVLGEVAQALHDLLIRLERRLESFPKS